MADQPGRPGQPEERAADTMFLPSPSVQADIADEHLGMVVTALDQVKELFEELRTYQAELEAQNEDMRRTQEALETSRSRYFDLYQMAPVGYLSINDQGLILEANLRASVLLGEPADKLVGQPLMRFISPQDRHIYNTHSQEIFQSGQPQVCILRVGQPEAAEPGVWVRMDATLNKDTDAVPVCRVVISDISKSKRVETVFQMHLELIEFAAHHLPREVLQKTLDQVGEITASPIGFYHFVHAQDQTLTLQAWSTRTVQEFCRAEGAGLHYPINQAGVWADAVRQGRPVIHNDYPSLPNRRGMPEGHATVVRELVVPILRGGQVVAILGVGNKATDYKEEDLETVAYFANAAWEIADRRQTEDALWESEHRLEQRERLAAIGQLAAGIAHDFNNILAVISLHLTMLAHASVLGTREEKRLDVIHEQIAHATHLIQQILDFGRRAVLDRHALDLGPFLADQVRLLARTLPDTIRVSLDCPPEEFLVLADPTRLQQMLFNLAANAQDAMPRGGALHLALSHQRSAPADSQGRPLIRMIVADSGPGFTSEARQHLFEPFFTTKPPGQGSGLGLAQVYGIVKQHGGDIELDPTEGQGATFSIYLPDIGPETPKSQDLAKKVTDGGGKTILVVEDNPVLLEALCDIVEMLGYQFLDASNGVEALAVLEAKSHVVRLVLSDQTMPMMSGDELLGAMYERGFNIPMVILSGHPLENELESLKEKGLVGWLIKPPNLTHLSQLLAQAVA